jgi:hypothetical protein
MVFIAVGEQRVRTCVQVVHVARQRVCTPQLPGCFYLLSSAVAASLVVLVLVMARLGGRSCCHNGRWSGGAGLDEPVWSGRYPAHWRSGCLLWSQWPCRPWCASRHDAVARSLPFGMTVRVANSDHGGLAVTFLLVATVLASSCSSRCLHPLGSWCWLRTDSTVTERMSWVSGCWQGMLAGCQSGCAPAVGACPRACLRCLAILPCRVLQRSRRCLLRRCPNPASVVFPEGRALACPGP